MTTIQPRAAISIDRLTKHYRDQTADDGLTLQVPEGSVFGLLGENGAGKTTTLQILLGLLSPDGGSRAGARPRSRASGSGDPSPGRLRARDAGPVRLDDRRGDRLVRRRVPSRCTHWRGGLSDAVRPAHRRLRPASQAQGQGPLQGNEGQGLAGACTRVGPRALDPRRADVGAGRHGSPGVSREHGRPCQHGPHGASFQPSDRRSRARGQPRGTLARGQADPRRIAR